MANVILVRPPACPSPRATPDLDFRDMRLVSHTANRESRAWGPKFQSRQIGRAGVFGTSSEMGLALCMGDRLLR